MLGFPTLKRAVLALAKSLTGFAETIDAANAGLRKQLALKAAVVEAPALPDRAAPSANGHAKRAAAKR